MQLTPPQTIADTAGRARVPHKEFMGIPFCLLNLAQTARLIIDTCGGPFAYVVTPNAHHVVMIHDQPAKLFPLYCNAWLSLCDSQIVRALAALQGLSLPLVTGSDLVVALLDEQNAALPGSKRRRFLVVGPDQTAERMLRARYQRATIEVLSAPPRLLERPELQRQVAQACAERQWDILLLCVGCPTQELIASVIAKEGRESGVALCVGAAIDFVVGRARRAPRQLQKLGLEWAYRLAHEPGRLWRRYLVESPKIVRIFLATRGSASR
jgi:N-acetylglucosaminyldiphosphoundecaprenol N-acetyl-beta-D-mannosaminyltransferase